MESPVYRPIHAAILGRRLQAKHATSSAHANAGGNRGRETLLYAVYNFDSVQNPQASRVPSESMKRGAPGLLSLLEKSPPRLIVPMERRCFDVLRDELPQRGYKRAENYQFPIPIPISIYGNPKRFHRNIFGFGIDGTGPLKESVVVKLPQHPAKIFRADYATECGKVVRDLFEQLAGVSE
jgi:hypothetical protein